jgi:hypothetical protein
MFDTNYLDLTKKGFLPARTDYEEGKMPSYLRLSIDGITILAEHIINEKYIIHRAVNPYGKHYDPYELQNDTFDNFNSLDDLIKFLKNDKTKSLV